MRRRDDMDKLWAPWRSKYIYSRKIKKCIFCGNRAADEELKYIVAKSKHSFAMLNLYPYNNGHVMVSPYRHVNSFELLSNEEILDMMKLVNRIKTVLDKRLKPHGYNIGANIGKVAGAGFAGHVHIHIVPRWTGDFNFMPIVSGTKVVSESLDVMYKLLRKK
ncbi:MAG: HIT domain-containing protein [Candidatus Omnitrophota bacterium]|nr:HIT domain-containing protein [Candidatus Omnitrophota bacterium]